ncbi:MAG: hypothetical protein AAFR31_20345, partial [Cyanobacteria bacterium J06627_8]
MTDKMLSRLRADMNSTLLGAAKGVDVEELLALYQEGEPNAEGCSMTSTPRRMGTSDSRNLTAFDGSY